MLNEWNYDDLARARPCPPKYSRPSTFEPLELGNFTPLAKYYYNRPKYNETIRDMLLNMVGKKISDIHAADVGAGTGIWTKQLSATGLRFLIAIEPNDAMRQEGEKYSEGHAIKWQAGCAESTGLKTNSLDFVSMASSFHWADFDLGVSEFNRVLKKDGWFFVLWNTRQIKGNSILEDIENKIFELKPNLKRVSSGASGITNTLEQKLIECAYFDDTSYIQGYHTEHWSLDRYIGAWKSVNDIQTQLGPYKFEVLLDTIKHKFCGFDEIAVTYKTRAWAARKTG